MTVNNPYSAALDERQTQHRLRRLRTFNTACGAEVSDNDSTYINFASNDYLGLTQHPELKSRAISYLSKFGTGLGSSRLMAGNLYLYDEIEAKIAAFKGTESALLLPTGYQTNSTLIAALAQTSNCFFADREDHNSILHGLKSARVRWQRYDHNDFDHLQTLLDRRKVLIDDSGTGSTWIVTETVFSMDGIATDVDLVSKIAGENGALLFLDEAHATGILGPQGRGLSHGKKNVEIAMGTFSKAMGSFGAYVACSKLMRDFLVNFCFGLIYSTALPPAVLGAIDASLDLVPQLDEERAKLNDMSLRVRDIIKSLELETIDSCTPIIPIIVGSDETAVDLSSFLEKHGILAPAIRPPTVPDGTARVRVSLTTYHTDEHLERLHDCLAAWVAIQKAEREKQY